MLSRRDRLRRAVILCASFARNLAYYRTGQSDEAKHLLRSDGKDAPFWRQVNGNFLDMAVLDWAKLFIDRNGEHHWRQVVSAPAVFEVGLLDHLGLTADDYNERREEIRQYRNKFVAHLDDLPVMQIPTLDVAWAALRFYHAHIVTHEGTPEDLMGLPNTPDRLEKGYDQSAHEAMAVYGGQ